MERKNEVRKKDYSISCTRFVAMCFIVVCHMMQRDAFSTDFYGAHIEWAFWFNIGVQMFLFISGLLYGNREIKTVSFYKRAFPKVLVDYYVFIFSMMVLSFFSPLLDIGIGGAFKLLTFSDTVPGLGHLWFIPTILFCYLLTPILSEILNEIDQRKDVRFWVEVSLLLIIIQVVVLTLFKSFNAAWINCFVIGMIYSRINKRKEKNKRVFNAIVIILCLFIIPIQFRLDYWPHRKLPSPVLSIYGILANYGHVFLGIATVMLIRFVFHKIVRSAKSHNHPLLDLSDKYSYDLYLVHLIFVNSAFGCVEFISNRLIALPLAVLLSILFSIILFHVSDALRKKLFKL